MARQEIETWVKAVGQYDNHEFEEALQTFQEIADTAKILFNCGVIHATLGQHHKAVSVSKMVEMLKTVAYVGFPLPGRMLPTSDQTRQLLGHCVLPARSFEFPRRRF